MNVLVIEDDQKLLTVLATLLLSWGHCVFKASSAKQGLKALYANKIQLILMDIFLRDITGCELIPKIKTISPETKIITMTGNSTRDLESRIRTMGILYYLIKPFEIPNLKAIINHIEPKTDMEDQYKTKVS